MARLRGDIAAHAAWLTDLQAGIGDVREAHGAQLEDVSKWLGSAILTLSSLSTTPVVTSPALQAAAPPARARRTSWPPCVGNCRCGPCGRSCRRCPTSSTTHLGHHADPQPCPVPPPGRGVGAGPAPPELRADRDRRRQRGRDAGGAGRHRRSPGPGDPHARAWASRRPATSPWRRPPARSSRSSTTTT